MNISFKGRCLLTTRKGHFSHIVIEYSLTFLALEIQYIIQINQIIKFFILKFGGLKLYNRLRPFFLGMALGGFLVPGVWLIVDLIRGEYGTYISTFP